MITGQFIYTITLMATFSVSLSEQESQNEHRLVRGHYSFNHPPNIEDYNPVSVIEVNDDTAQSTKSLKKGLTVARSLKDVSLPDVKSIESNVHKSREYENIPGQSKKIENIESKHKVRALRSQQIPVTFVYESQNPEGNNEYERISIKPTYKVQPQRRRKETLLKSKKNETFVPINENPQKPSITESITFKPTLETPRQEDKVKPIGFQERSNTKGPKRARERKPVIPIIESENFVYSHTGDFHYSYEGGDGTKAFERGELKTFEDKTAGEAVVGSFSYTDKEGNDFSLSYTADENGYRPEGAHLPTPPPIPPAIARALLYLSTKTTPQPVTKSYL